jgi:hypothetical protein
MIRPTVLPAPKSDVEDHSMRIVEYAMALIALATAAILAFLR